MVISESSEILAFEGIDTQVLNIPDDKTYRLDILIMVGLDFDPKYAGIGFPSINTEFSSSNTVCHLPLVGKILSISVTLLGVGRTFVKAPHFIFGIFGIISLISRKLLIHP